MQVLHHAWRQTLDVGWRHLAVRVLNDGDEGPHALQSNLEHNKSAGEGLQSNLEHNKGAGEGLQWNLDHNKSAGEGLQWNLEHKSAGEGTHTFQSNLEHNKSISLKYCHSDSLYIQTINHHCVPLAHFMRTVSVQHLPLHCHCPTLHADSQCTTPTSTLLLSHASCKQSVYNIYLLPSLVGLWFLWT